MLDSIYVSTIQAHDTGVYAVAGYVNGKYNTWDALVAAYAGTDMYLLSIDVANDPSAGAQCLDIETGDASISDAPAWTKATAAAGKAANDYRYYPKLYTSRNNVVALVNAMDAAGIQRDTYMVWSAHYGDGSHICGPNSCGLAVQCDATQYTDSYAGASLDASICYGYFFAGPPAPPAPQNKKTVPALDGLSCDDALTAAAKAGFTVHCSPPADKRIPNTPYVVTSQTPGKGVVLVQGETGWWPATAEKPTVDINIRIKEPVLQLGDTGAAVKLLQTLLNGRPIKPNLAVDGVFGQLTQAAVEELQRNNKITVDGIVGPQTWAILGDYT